MARKKVEYEVTLKLHTVIDDDGTPNKIEKEVRRQADLRFYQNSDSCEARVTNVEDLD